MEFQKRTQDRQEQATLQEQATYKMGYLRDQVKKHKSGKGGRTGKGGRSVRKLKQNDFDVDHQVQTYYQDADVQNRKEEYLDVILKMVESMEKMISNATWEVWYVDIDLSVFSHPNPILGWYHVDCFMAKLDMLEEMILKFEHGHESMLSLLNQARNTVLNDETAIHFDQLSVSASNTLNYYRFIEDIYYAKIEDIPQVMWDQLEPVLVMILEQIKNMDSVETITVSNQECCAEYNNSKQDWFSKSSRTDAHTRSTKRERKVWKKNGYGGMTKAGRRREMKNPYQIL